MRRKIRLPVALCLAMLGINAHGVAVCPGDANNNGTVNGDDLVTIIGHWGWCIGGPDCPGDVAPEGGDSLVNVLDLLAVLNNWGPCPCLPFDGCMPGGVLWFEDWETGDYSRWTGPYATLVICGTSGFSTEQVLGSGHSHKSYVFCATDDSHRGYGGLRFEGDQLVESFAIPSSGGTIAPYGVVTTFWCWMDCPYPFSTERWMGFFSVTHDCSNAWNGTIGLVFDDPSGRLKPSHVLAYEYTPDAPPFPLRQWNRVTVYVNYHTGYMHVWQNGQKIAVAYFIRPDTRPCQWRWGIYASGPNDNIVLYEDDIKIIKLAEPLEDFETEPLNVLVPGPTK